jgi:hypothetical protein
MRFHVLIQQIRSNEPNCNRCYRKHRTKRNVCTKAEGASDIEQQHGDQQRQEKMDEETFQLDCPTLTLICLRPLAAFGNCAKGLRE